MKTLYKYLNSQTMEQVDPKYWVDQKDQSKGYIVSDVELFNLGYVPLIEEAQPFIPDGYSLAPMYLDRIDYIRKEWLLVEIPNPY